MPRLRRMLTLLLVTLVAGYVALCVVVFAVQRSFIYFPPPPEAAEVTARAGIETLGGAGEPAQEILHLRAALGAPTLVFFHGNGEQLLDLVGRAQTLNALGLGFFGVEYPGYGRTAGKPSETSILAAAERALAELRKRGVTKEQTVLVGQSLGSGVATELARRGHGARLVLLSPYTSLADMAQRSFRFLPARFLVLDRFDTASKASSVQVPVLLIHGEADTLIPAQMSRELAAAFPHATLRLIPGADHNDLWVVERGAVFGEVATFAREATGVRAE